MADSDSEVSFESADEGETEKETGKENVDQGDSSKPDPVTSALEDTKAVRNQKQDDNAANSGTEKSAEKSRTKSGEKGEEKKAESNSDQSETKAPDPIDVSGREKESLGGEENKKRDSGNEEETKTQKKEGSSEKEEDREKGDGKKEKDQKEPEGEEIANRGMTSGEDPKDDAMSGGAPPHAAASSGGWGWGGWGSSLLSSAAATVTKVSDNVGKGLTSVIENVETSLGVPKPEELTEKEKQEVERKADEKEKEASKPAEGDIDKPEGEATPDEPGSKPKEEEEEEEKRESAGAGIGGLFSFGASAISNVMEKTVSGGLDALEMIGRKTMDILQEGDPRLEKKRARLIPRKEKINLSETLRQAKEEAEAEIARQREEEELQKYNFGMLFDQFQGLAHLEALEMLSNQSETKVQSSIAMVDDDALDEMKTELMEVRDAFQLEEMEAEEEDTSSDQDFVSVVTELLFSLSIAATPDKLKRVQKETRDWLSRQRAGQTQGSEEEDAKLEIKDVHAKAMQTLAELTARTIEQFHKVAELMLLDQEKDQARSKSPVEGATALSKLASILSAEVSSVASKFCELLSSMADKGSPEEEINTIITNIYLEASNSTSYIQDAFQLLLPVMQDIVVRRKCPEEST